MIKLKTQEEIKILKEGGKRHAEILRKVASRVAPGVLVSDLDKYAHELVIEEGDEAAFLNYTPEGISYPYPNTLCVSVNDEVVHGIPEEGIVLQEGDIVSLDIGLKHKGFITDAAITVPVGEVSPEAKRLMEATRKSLYAGIKEAKPGNTTGDIGAAIEEIAKKEGLGIVRILSGHGVGYEVHEDPYIPNYGRPGSGTKLEVGMVIAIEPMFTLGEDDVSVAPDEYTFMTTDGSLSAHFEHTIAITEKGPLILTE